MSTPITALTEEHARLLAGGASAMTIKGADMAAGTFAGVAWSELTFTACDFNRGWVNVQAALTPGLRDTKKAVDAGPVGPGQAVRLAR